MAKFHYNLFDESDHHASTTATHICILIQFILTKKWIAPLFTTIWDHTDGCTNQYCCASAIYLLSCIDLEYCININRAVGAPGHGKYFINGPNDRDKQILKLII